MEASTGASAPPRLLVVEDSPSDFAMLEIELRDGTFANAFIDRATTLASARDHLRTHEYDCALVDLGLPDSDGLETFDAIAALAGSAAVVVLSGLDSQTVAAEAVRRGAQDYLVKGGGDRSREVARAISYAVRRQQLLEELRSATAEQLALKDQLLSHVSHELRSPLAVVHQFATLLSDGLAGSLTPKQHDFLDVLIRNVDQLKIMIDDLLQAGRDRRHENSLDCRRVDLSGLLGDVVEDYRPVAEQRGLRLLFTSGVVPPVLADPGRVREVLGNLIDNAMKFTAPGGCITLTTTATADGVRVTVTDTGCGISATELPHIFENFFQSRQSDLAGRSGLGLGLFVSKNLIVSQGGRMWAESTPGVGTAISFTLPQVLVHAERGSA